MPHPTPSTSNRSSFIAFAIISSVLSSVGTIFKVQGVRHVPPLLAAAGGVLFAGLQSFFLPGKAGKTPPYCESGS